MPVCCHGVAATMKGPRPIPGFETEKALAAQKAVEFVTDGMIVGLGSGTTAAYAVKCLSNRIGHGLRITAVATSQATENLARSLRVPLIDFQRLSWVDLTIDGADEIDHRFQAIKGGGGALLREKVIAAASNQMIAIVDSSKLVPQLGKFPLAVEVVPFATEFVRARLVQLGAHVTIRMLCGTPFLTDQSNYILDASWGVIAMPTKIAATIAAIVGVVEHGLFLTEVDTMIVARGNTVEVRHRGQA